jgi:hypothetical protein
MTTAAIRDDSSAGIVRGREAAKRCVHSGRGQVLFSCRTVLKIRSNNAWLPDIVNPVGPGASTLKPSLSNAVDARWIISAPTRCLAMVAAVIGRGASRMHEPSRLRSTTCAMTSSAILYSLQRVVDIERKRSTAFSTGLEDLPGTTIMLPLRLPPRGSQRQDLP